MNLYKVLAILLLINCPTPDAGIRGCVVRARQPGPGCCQSGLSGAHETLSRARGRDTCHGQLQLCSDKPRNRKKGKSLHNNKKINFWKVIIVCQSDLRSWAGLDQAGLGWAGQWHRTRDSSGAWKTGANE